ncbi:MAG TPA: DUF1592 domain-containing protein [Vicinamibacterales bacterium]|nr:DUF1592 domain-containing protein [Vicinamibacterales bacterium]
MPRIVFALAFAAVFATAVATVATQQQPAPSVLRPAVAPLTTFGPAAQTALVKQYCVGCHSDRGKAGGLSLAAYDTATAASAEHVATTEKMIRKLRAGMMPPAGARRPEGRQLLSLAEALETRIDRAAALSPNPGARPFQRLNRAEYARAVKEILGVDVDVTGLLPADTISHGFDNVADSQSFSATLMESYLRAAGKVVALAVGDPKAADTETNYRVPKTASQWGRADGAPLGTRGGLSVMHTFPADGDYLFRVELHSNACGVLFGGPTEGEQIEVSVDGARVQVLNINPRMTEEATGLSLLTAPVQLRAGPHRVSAAFVQRFEGPVNDLIAPIDHSLADTQIGVALGITTLPHVKDLTILGPRRVTGLSATDSRRRIFTCRPTGSGDESICATSIVKRIASQAFRAPVKERDLARLMRFYSESRAEGNFEYAIAAALEAILASPQFLFRLESAPATARPGQSYRLTDLELASRLSFFIWGSGPDEALLKVAAQGGLSLPGGLEKQVRRMLADRRSESLSTRFASQWLRLNDVDQMLPDAILYPYFDRRLGDAFKRETELFFDSLIRDDRSLLDLLTADYTFANDRIAAHYGIANVTGSEFRRVKTPPERRGILGHGSMLVLTSVADRTSPVMRGKWVMEVLLGSPPPPPPPNVPALEDTKADIAGKVLTVRGRMEEHRKNPACTSCHRVIDPLGLALENFDVTGKWRIKDASLPIDPSGELYDGTKMDGPAGLRAALLKHQDAVVLSFTESLMTYALGRRVEAFDMPTIRRIVRDASRSGNRMSAFVLGVAKSPAFSMSRAGAALTTASHQPTAGTTSGTR